MTDMNMGNAAIDRASIYNSNYTFVDLLNPSDFQGALYKVDIYCNTAGNFKIKVWRDVGSNYVMISSETVTLAIGFNTFTLITPVNVLVGDFIGGSMLANCKLDVAASGGSAPYIAGDVGTTAKASFIASSCIVSIYGYIRCNGILTWFFNSC